MQEFLNYIDGDHRPARSGAWLDSFEPATGSVWARVPASDEGDLDEAVTAAWRAFESGGWRERPNAHRANVLRAWADLIEANAARLAEVESRDNGRPIRETRDVQIPGAAMQMRFIAGLAESIQGTTTDVRPDAFTYTVWEPVGVVGLIIPWNGPLPLFFAKTAAALAAGNAIIIKPAQQASASILAATSLLDELDLPAGMVQVVSGRGSVLGDAMAAHPRIRKISFTGSTATGQQIMRRAAGNVKNLLLELGGKSPNIIFGDADLDRAATAASAGIFTPNAGQACVAGSRVLVEESAYDEVLERLRTKAEALRLGDPLDPATDMGPLATDGQFQTVREYIADGQKEGARLVSGGETAGALATPLRDGYFVPPTLFAADHNQHRISQEEIFGPVAVVIPFRGEDEAVRLANDTPYGLATGLWTSDVRRAHRLTRRLEAGSVWVNTYKAMHWAVPFGGHKQSGFGGTSNGHTALQEWMEPKTVWMDIGT